MQIWLVGGGASPIVVLRGIRSKILLLRYGAQNLALLRVTFFCLNWDLACRYVINQSISGTRPSPLTIESSVNRESTSNNRVKSGYTNRPTAPIDMVPSAGAVSGTADGRQEQYLPLPLQANKQHMSPQPTQNMYAESSTSLLGSSTAVNTRGIPSLLISTSGVESFDQGGSNAGAASGLAGGHAAVGSAGGSVDLSSFRRTGDGDEFVYEPETATRSNFALADGNGSNIGVGHRPRESFDEAAWEGMDGSPGGTFESEEGQPGPGPSTIRALNASAIATSAGPLPVV